MHLIEVGKSSAEKIRSTQWEDELPIKIRKKLIITIQWSFGEREKIKQAIPAK